MKFKFPTFFYLLPFTLFLFFGYNSFSQGDLESIFSRSNDDKKFYIGTSLTRPMGGVVSLDFDYRFRSNFFSLQGGVGVIPFGYRLSEFKLLDEVGFGTYYSFAGLFEFDGTGASFDAVTTHIGLLFEHFKYQLRDEDYFDSPFKPFDYELENDAQLVFDRREVNIGVSLMATYMLTNKFAINFQTSLGALILSKRYDESASSGVVWKQEIPEGWFNNDFMKVRAFVSVNIGLKYNIL